MQPLMFRRLADAEDGVALVLAVVTMLILSALSASVLFAVAVNQRSSQNQAQANQAFGLAEDGLAYAEGRLYVANDPSNAADVPTTTFTQDSGTVTYSGTLNGSTWTLTGKGTVGPVTRTVTAQAVVPPAQTTSSSSTIWNYIYINNPSGCTTLSGNLTLNVPLYTQGSLCLNGHVTFTGSDLEVGGNLTLTGSAKIGKSSSQAISTMNVAGTCSPAPCDGSHKPIWVNAPGVGNTVPTVTMPTIDLASEYASTDPGPASGHSCQAGSGVPTPFFDNDTTLNNSLATVNLFPAGQPYDCKVGSSEIKWDGSGNLYVNGVFYFDGSLSMSGNEQVVYSGSGSLYFTGTISMSGSTELCGIQNCTSQWNPNDNVLVLVAGCWADSTGSTLVGSSCVALSGNAKLQAGTYVTTDYSVTGTVDNMGPVVANSASLAGNVTEMIPLSNLPPGAPSNTTTVQPPAGPPQNFSG